MEGDKRALVPRRTSRIGVSTIGVLGQGFEMRRACGWENESLSCCMHLSATSLYCRRCTILIYVVSLIMIKHPPSTGPLIKFSVATIRGKAINAELQSSFENFAYFSHGSSLNFTP